MRLFLIFILLTIFSKKSVGQDYETRIFFSQFENGFYKNLTKETFFIVDSIVNLNSLEFKEMNIGDSSLTTEDIDFISASLKNRTGQILDSPNIG